MTHHQAEWIRDVPRSCTCDWEWVPAERRFVLRRFKTGCVWHGK